VGKDLVKAIELYKQAAEAGAPGAKEQLAWCYRNGIGVEKNPTEAVRLYREVGCNGMAAELEAKIASEK